MDICYSLELVSKLDILHKANWRIKVILKGELKVITPSKRSKKYIKINKKVRKSKREGENENFKRS